MSPPEGRGGGDMLPFTEPCSLLVPRIAGSEVPFLWEPCPTSPSPSLGLPSGQLEKGTLGPISASFSLAQGFHQGDPFSFSLFVKFCLFLALEHWGGRVHGPTWAQLPSGLASRGFGGGESCPALQSGSAQKVRPVDMLWGNWGFCLGFRKGDPGTQ